MSLSPAGKPLKHTVLVPDMKDVSDALNGPIEDMKKSPSRYLGLDESAPPSRWENWYRRVARYVAYLLDGGVHFELTLHKVAKVAMNYQTQKLISDQLNAMLEYCLYFRLGEQYEPDTILAKVEALHARVKETGDVRFTMNDRVCVRLLEAGWLEYQLGGLYVEFLSMVLMREGGRATALSEAVCAQAAILASESLQFRELTDKHFLSRMFSLLRSSDVTLVEMVAKALVNLSTQNAVIKSSIIEAGLMQQLRQFLLAVTPEPAISICLLIKQLAFNNASMCLQILSIDLIVDLFALLMPLPSGAKPAPKLVRAASAAIWNSLYNPGNLTQLLQHTRANGMVVEPELAISTLCDRFLEQPPSENETYEKLAGILMWVAFTSGSYAQMMAEQRVTERVIELLGLTEDVAAVRALLGLLVTMCRNSDARIRASNHGQLDSAIEAATKTADVIVKDFLRELTLLPDLGRLTPLLIAMKVVD